MTNSELNIYIKNYLEHDKSHSAIMLTAPWGAGKSYYIEHELVPFLGKEENGSHACVLVSLYGLSSLFELSKALYMESRMSIFAKSSEKVTTGVFAAKTILKGAASFFGIDLSKSQEEMKQLYDSVDLSGKLIIIEDLERSGIDILEILGYVNSLTEKDGIKVLLVANEKELIRYKPRLIKNKEQQDISDTLDRITDNTFRIHSDKTKAYLSTKEKTVSDTIYFEGDATLAIRQIMAMYDNKFFSPFMSEVAIADLLKYLHNCGLTNLRTFIFACQKANDIFERIKPNPESEMDYIKTIFYGIIAFSNRIKTGRNQEWDGGHFLAAHLSSEDYPLFRFCYDYIRWQSFDITSVKGSKDELKKYRLYTRDKSFDDKDLKTLENWWFSTEKEIREAISSITDRLQNEESIPFYQYGRIAVNMIRAKSIIGGNIEKAKELLVKNLHNRGSEINADYLFLASMIDETNPEVLSEFNDLKEQMAVSLAAKETTIFDFDYLPTNINIFCDAVYQNQGRILQDGAFAARLDMKKMAKMLKSCAALDIYHLREAFHTVYKAGNINDFLSGDRENIIALMGEVKSLEVYEGYDKIQQLHIRKFHSDLADIVSRL